MRRCFPAAARPGPFRTGKWAGLPQSYDFILGFRRELPIFSRRVRKLWGFGGGQRSGCGRESGWILGDFSRGRWSISVIVSAFFLGFLGEGGRRWACARVASGAGRRKKVHPTAHALWDAPKKGIMGRKSVENLSLARRRVGAALRVGGGVRRFSLRGRGQPLSDGAEVEFRGRFFVRKGERLTGWDDYLWVYSSYSLMYSITMSMASGRMSLMRGLLTQSYTMG